MTAAKDPAAAGAPVLAEVAADHPAAWADLTAAWATPDLIGDLIGDHQPMPARTAIDRTTADRIVLSDAVSAHHGRPHRGHRTPAPLFDKAARRIETTTRIDRKGT